MEDRIIPADMIVSRNGDRALRFINTGRMSTIHSGLQDLSTVRQTFAFNQDKIHLGLLYTFDDLGIAMGRPNAVPRILVEMLENKAVIEVDGQDGGFTYSTPIRRFEPLMIIANTEVDEAGETPGLGGAPFPVYLNKALRQSDVITYDLEDGIQVIVCDEYDIEPVGDGFRHMVKITQGSGQLYFPLDKLIAGTQYFKPFNSMGEFSEEYSTFHFDYRTEELLQEFNLGNHTSVSVGTTLYGAEKQTQNMTAQTKAILDSIINSVNDFQTSTDQPYDSFLLMQNFNLSQIQPNGVDIDADNTTVMSLFEAMSVMELSRMEVQMLLWAKEAVITEINGHKRINEGLYTQMRRGHIFTYAVPGGVDLVFLQGLSNAIFIHSDMKADDREWTMYCGQALYDNIEWVIQQHGVALLQDPLYRQFLGNTRSLPESPVSGPLDALRIRELKIADVLLPGVGRLRLVHDASLDWNVGKDRFSNQIQYTQARGKGTYSGYVDVRKANMTNLFTDPKIQGNRNVLDANIINRNSVYYVRPRQSIHWGWDHGRMNSVSNMGMEISHFSNHKQMRTEFWMHTRSAAWLADKSSIFWIELEKPRITSVA